MTANKLNKMKEFTEHKDKEEIFNKAMEKRCKYESSKCIDSDMYYAIMDAMEDYATQQTKESALALSQSVCTICKNQLTYFEIDNNTCINCGNSLSVTEK